MVNEAKSHAADDKKRREEVDVRNSADQLAYQTEKNIKEYGEKIDPDAKGKLEAAVGRVKEALKGSSKDEIKSASDALNQIWQEAAAKMYQQTAGAQGGPGPGPGAGPSGAGPEPGGDKKNVQDADYEVVDDNKP
jgi:molecular chaperone DnaK